MKITKLNLHTNNLDETEDFYAGILELPIVKQSGSEISFLISHTILTFLLTANINPYYHLAFSIPTDKVDEAHAYIASKTTILPFTAETTIADFSNWNAHAFYFHDNQGNILEFIAHHDLSTHSNKPFNSSSIIGICEIGIPVDDVTTACSNINTKYRVPYYVKGPRLKDFSVMGDEQGLFIVTKTGRGWLPTQQPSERHFTEVIFENEGETMHLKIEDDTQL